MSSKNTFVPTSNKTARKMKCPAKDDISIRKGNTNLNQTSTSIAHRANVTMLASSSGDENKECDDLTKKLSYNEYLESLFLESLVDDKIEREKTEIDVKMAELAKRLEINKLILRKTQDRLKDISFLSEQQRILDEKKIITDGLLNQCNEFEADDFLDDFQAQQDAYCNRLLTKNIDLGKKENGCYVELHSAITSTIESLEKVKQECNLNSSEMERMFNISQSLQDCGSIKNEIETNLQQHNAMTNHVSSNVLEVASIELASTLS